MIILEEHKTMLDAAIEIINKTDFYIDDLEPYVYVNLFTENIFGFNDIIIEKYDSFMVVNNDIKNSKEKLIESVTKSYSKLIDSIIIDRVCVGSISEYPILYEADDYFNIVKKYILPWDCSDEILWSLFMESSYELTEDLYDVLLSPLSTSILYSNNNSFTDLVNNKKLKNNKVFNKMILSINEDSPYKNFDDYLLTQININDINEVEYYLNFLVKNSLDTYQSMGNNNLLKPITKKLMNIYSIHLKKELNNRTDFNKFNELNLLRKDKFKYIYNYFSNRNNDNIELPAT